MWDRGPSAPIHEIEGRVFLATSLNSHVSVVHRFKQAVEKYAIYLHIHTEDNENLVATGFICDIRKSSLSFLLVYHTAQFNSVCKPSCRDPRRVELPHVISFARDE